MKNLKIGYITKYFHPIKGGAENYILNLALQSVQDGHDVHVFTSDRKGRERLHNLEDNYKGIKIHRYKSLFDFSLYLGFYPMLLPKLLKADLDIIHVSGFGFIWHDLVLILKKLVSKKTKFINTPHGPFMALSEYNIVLKFIKTLYTSIQKLFLSWLYDIIIQVNTFQWRWIMKYKIDKSKIKFVPNAIPEKLLHTKIPPNDKDYFEKKYALENKYVISNLGRISKYKGVQHIIEILPELIKIEPEIVLLIMGRDDGYVHSLKALAARLHVENNIRFAINVNEKEKLIGLEVSQIFIFPSEWEAFGIVLLEAMTRNNAIIATRTEGGKYLVTEDANGYLYDHGDKQKLLELTTKLIQDRKLLMTMQKQNKQKVKQFIWEEVYQKHYKPILQLLGRT